MSRITHLLFAIAFDLHLSVSIALHCVSAITCTFVACCTSTYISMDSCSSTSTMFSSLASFCTICASTKCYSIASSSFDSSMNIGSTNVVISLFAFLHANVFCFCVKTQLQMFQLYLCLELSSTEIVSSHYILSFLHIQKAIMNATTTFQPTAKYSTCLLFLLFSILFYFNSSQ
jgi:hypothetical protein